MKIISGHKTLLKNKISTIKEVLNDMNHFKQFLPLDKISNWKSTSNTCSFEINGISEIYLQFVNSNKDNEITYKSNSKNSFDFTIIFIFDNDINDSGYCTIQLHGEISSMKYMLIKTPLTNFLNMITHKIADF